MLDFDLVSLYRSEAKRLKESNKSNPDKSQRKRRFRLMKNKKFFWDTISLFTSNLPYKNIHNVPEPVCRQWRWKHSPIICIRAADIRLDLTGHAVLSFNLIGCHCVNFRYILLPHLCEAVIPL